MLLCSLLALVSLSQSDRSTVVTNGFFTAPNGVQIKLVGYANGDAEVGPVYGADGKPVSKAGTKEFADYTGDKGYAGAASSKRQPERWLVAFKLIGPRDKTLDIDFADRYSSYGTAGPDPVKGKLHASMYVRLKNSGSNHFDIQLKMPSGPFVKLAEFGEDGSCNVEGFHFDVEMAALPAFRQTIDKRDEFTFQGYRGTGYVPIRFKGHDFKLEASDQIGKPLKKDPGDMFASGMIGMVETGVESGRLEVQFMGQLPLVKERFFVLSSRPMMRVSMRLKKPDKLPK